MHDRKSPSRDSLVVNASIPPQILFFCPFFTRNAWYSRLWYSAGIPPGILIWRGILGIPAKNLGISWYTQTLVLSALAVVGR